MSTISLRLPESLHKRVRELAKRENVSINQFISTALAEKLSALLTVEYLEERGRRGDRAAFDRVLAKVRDVEPDEDDRTWPRRSVVRESAQEATDRYRTEELPPPRHRTCVERISETRMAGQNRRSWTGNDRNARAHHGKVRLEEDPLYIELRWKDGPGARPRSVGHFKLDLRKLLAGEYVRQEQDGTIRLRFYHGPDGVFYVQQRLDYPAIPIGRDPD
jgi:hypothetical protein